MPGNVNDLRESFLNWKRLEMSQSIRIIHGNSQFRLVFKVRYAKKHFHKVFAFCRKKISVHKNVCVVISPVHGKLNFFIIETVDEKNKKVKHQEWTQTKDGFLPTAEKNLITVVENFVANCVKADSNGIFNFTRAYCLYIFGKWEPADVKTEKKVCT